MHVQNKTNAKQTTQLANKIMKTLVHKSDRSLSASTLASIRNTGNFGVDIMALAAAESTADAKKAAVAAARRAVDDIGARMNREVQLLKDFRATAKAQEVKVHAFDKLKVQFEKDGDFAKLKTGAQKLGILL